MFGACLLTETHAHQFLHMNVCVLKAAAENNLHLNCRDLFAHSLISLTSLYKMQAHSTMKRDFFEPDKREKKIIKLSCVAAKLD